MSDSNNNSNRQKDTTTSTISYLPILFANGYPIALDKMSVEQLELFIPFLVKCSLNLKVDDIPTTAPEWWPESLIEYRNCFAGTIFAKPKNFKKNWQEVMKTIVLKCYEFHGQPFLLAYSKDLSENDTANLRYVRDSISTTALYSIKPDKLLLTFRNELMTYDRKKRRQLWKKDESPQDSAEDESESFMAICDYCDATFVSDEAFTEHEKKCNNAPDEQEIEQEIENIVISDDEDDYETVDKADQLSQTDYMAYFYLASSTATELPIRSHRQIEQSLSPKKKKKQARTRNIVNIKDREKEYAIPFSSPAGVILTKKPIDNAYKMDKFYDIESLCAAKPNSRIPIRPKSRFQQSSTETYLMKAMRKTRPYYWPKRHLHSETREQNFEFLNRWLIEDCKPCIVKAPKLSVDDVIKYRADLERIRREREKANCVDLISDSDEDDDAPIIAMEEGIKEALTKFEAQITAFPLNSAGTSKDLPKYSSKMPVFPPPTSLVSKEIQINRRIEAEPGSSMKIHETTITPVELQNGKTKTENDSSHDSKRSKSIHEWLNNVNGENFNQISHLVNS